MTRNSDKLYLTVISFFVAICAGLFWWSYCDTYFTGDETLFCYRIDQGVQGLIVGDDVDIEEVDKISSVGDVFRSQAFHWRYGHGRNIITGVEQLFSGTWPTQLFYVINTLVWVYCIWLTIMLGVKGRWRRSLWIWLLTVGSYLFLFPGEADLFTSINLSTNYLWPIAMTLSAYALWLRYRLTPIDGKRKAAIALAVASLILAWSHEAWCLPMSATLIVWYIFLARNERKTVGFVMAWGYWAGSLILLASPGNYNRTYIEILGPMTEGIWPKVMEMLISITYCNIFWILVIVLALTVMWHPARMWRFIVDNRFMWIAGVFSMGFVMVFHTTERSFTAVDMISLILLLRFIGFYSRTDANVNRLPWLAMTLMAGVVAVMGYVAQLQRKVTAAEKAAIDWYVDDPDGLSVVSYPPIPDWVSPWIRCKLPSIFSRLTFNWERFNEQKPMHVLNDVEYNLLNQHPEQLFSPDNRIGKSPFYTVDEALSAWTTDSTVRHQFWIWDLAPASVNDHVGPFRKLGRILFVPFYSKQSRGNYVDSVVVGSKNYYRIDKYPGRGLQDAHFWR